MLSRTPRLALALLVLALAACSSRGSSPPTTTTTGTTAGTGGTGGAPTTTSSMGSTGGAAGSGVGGSGGAGGAPADAGDLDAASLPDGLGKGGLPLGAMCGDYAQPGGGADAGTSCGAGLACCYPCKMQMCDTVCVIACSPHETGCLGGCIPQI